MNLYNNVYILEYKHFFNGDIMISMIVAVDNTNNESGIGKDGMLKWHIPEDLKFFKQFTLNKTLIVGRKTFENLPQLKNRKIMVLTNNPTLIDNETYFDLDDIKKTIFNDKLNEFVIIGGKQIYELFIDSIDYAVVNEITFKKDENKNNEYDTNLSKLFNQMKYNDNQFNFKNKYTLIDNENYKIEVNEFKVNDKIKFTFD